MNKITGLFVTLLVFCPLLSLSAGIVINEIHYAQEDKTVPEEFIELYNAGDAMVDLSGWYFSSGLTYLFPQGSSLAPGSFLVIAQDPETFRDIFGDQAVFGPFDGRLANEGEKVILNNAAGFIEDRVDYRRAFPWPVVGGDMGCSIELINPAMDNDLGGSWRPSGTLGTGLPHRHYFIQSESSQWTFRKGTSEPPADWRTVDYDEDDSWVSAQSSIGYGDNDDNTVLDDMQNGYNTIYLRQTFNIESEDMIPSQLVLDMYVDDGAIVWINDQEVGRFHVSDGDKQHDDEGENHDAQWESGPVAQPGSILQVGENVIAVHVLNTRIGSSDLSIDLALFVPADNESLLGTPTPGAVNAAFSENAPPQIRQASHAPFQPVSDEDVLVTIKATDPDGMGSVVLEYQVVEPGAYIRLTDTRYDTEWDFVAMNDAGVDGDLVASDDIYSAIVPASVQRNRRLVRYRIIAEDADGRAVVGPSPEDPQPNFAYFVYDGIPPWQGASRPGSTPVMHFTAEDMSALPVYFLIALESDVIDSQYSSSYDGVHFLGTMVYEGRVYDHMEFENRGEYSTYVSGKNKWRMHFNRGHGFQARDNYGKKYRTRWKRMNLSAAATPWVPTNRGMGALGEAVAFKLYEMAGTLSPKTNFFQFRVIDDPEEAHATDQYSGDLWGLYMTIEHTDGRFLDERGLPDGNTYKIEGGGGDKRNQGPTQTVSSSDYNALKAYNQHQPVTWWQSNVDLDSYYAFRAVNCAVNNMDLREGWNICQYHHPDNNRWYIMPWDLDMLYMPVTHWSGVMNFQNAMSQHAQFSVAYKNRGRALQDLLFSSDQVMQVVNELAAFENPPGRSLTFVDVDEAMWNYHPRTASNHRGVFYRNPSTHSARGGTITRTLASADHEGMARWIHDFIVTGYGRNFLNSQINDGAIPDTPTVTPMGDSAFPVDDLTFRSSAFGDPNGDHTFQSMQWRAGEVTHVDAPVYDPASPKVYEIDAAWESDVLQVYNDIITVPATALKIGAAYRIRVRMQDATGRWSHWSAPLEFITTDPLVPFPQKDWLRITEIMYFPEGNADLEFVELQNVGPVAVSLDGLAFTNGIEFDFSDGPVQELLPGEILVVVQNAAVFESHHQGKDILVAGEYSGQLENAGEQIALTYGGNTSIHDFAYAAEWYPAASGGGFSLTIDNPEGPLSAWGQKEGWRESSLMGGTPGEPDGGGMPGGWQRPGDANQDGGVDLSDAISFLLLLFSDGMAPPCEGAGLSEGGNLALLDGNGDEAIDLADVIHLLAFLFQDGPAPVLGRSCVKIEGCGDACRF